MRRWLHEENAGILRPRVKNIIKNIKAAKETENIVHGLVSNSTDFRSAKDEIFLCDTGAKVSIIGLRKIVEASGGTLDIVGQCELFVKLAVLGRTKS